MQEYKKQMEADGTNQARGLEAYGKLASEL
jgi:hypothetical protein